MMSEIALCLDSESARAPELIGLDGENLDSQPWLHLWTGAAEAREHIRSNDALREVWVVSSDDMDSINLAAAIKRDDPDRMVCLVAFAGGGSLRSRAAAAGIDAVLSRTVFIRRYARQKAEQLMTRGDKDPKQKVTHQALSNVHHFADFERPQIRLPDIADEGDCEKTTARASEKMPEQVPELILEAVAQKEVRPPVQTPEQALKCRADEQLKVAQTAGRQAVCEQASAQSPKRLSDTRRMKSIKDVANIPIVKRNNFLIAVVGAAGGVGKSAVSSLTAYFAQGFGLRTLLIDADFQFGDMHYLTGTERPLAIDEACNDSRLLVGLRASGSAPALLAAPSRLEHSEELSGAVSMVLDTVHEGFDVVVANTGAHWGEMQARLLEQANLVIFLVDQRASALRKARHAIELCGRCGIPTSSFIVAVNRCSRNALINSFDASCSLGGLRAIELRDGGREVDELLGAGLPLELIASGNEFCVSLEHFLVDVLPHKEGSLLAEVDELAKHPKSKRRRGRRGRDAACL